MSQPYLKKHAPGGKGVCKFFLQGRCRNSKCQFQHTSDTRVQPQTSIMVTLLKLLFQKQQLAIYDPERGAVNLSKLRQCEDLKDVTASVDFNTVSFCEAICAVIAEMVVPPPSILALDDNNISSLGCFFRSMQKHNLHASVTAISARSNQISTLDFLTNLRSFSSLSELALNDNPVTNVPNYRSQIRQSLPHLVGLDMKCVQPEPLSLPWPAFSQVFDQPSQHVLSFLESFVKADTNSLPDFYAPDCYFTIALQQPSAAMSSDGLKCGSDERTRELVKDAIIMKLRQTDNDHNILRGLKTVSIFKGRTMVCSKVLEFLHPQHFDVVFDLHPNPQVVLLGIDSAVATMHGFVNWFVRGDPEKVTRRRFSRTCCVTVKGGGCAISNDMLQLYVDDPSVLLDCKSAARLAQTARRYHVDASVAGVASSMVQSDFDLCAVLKDISGVPVAVLEECAQVGGTVEIGLSVARLVGRQCLTPAQALSLFQSVNCDVARLKEVL